MSDVGSASVLVLQMHAPEPSEPVLIFEWHGDRAYRVGPGVYRFARRDSLERLSAVLTLSVTLAMSLLFFAIGGAVA